jgi:hypothetical protein
MKVAPITAALTAVVALGSIASPVLAQGYGYYPDPARDASQSCQVVKHQSQTTGGILGALAGAVLGSNIAQGGGRTGGALIGAAAGAVVGSNIGLSSSRDSGACRAAATYGDYRPSSYGGAYYSYGYDRTPYRQGYPDYPRDAYSRQAYARSGGDDYRYNRDAREADSRYGGARYGYGYGDDHAPRDVGYRDGGYNGD